MSKFEITCVTFVSPVDNYLQLSDLLAIIRTCVLVVAKRSSRSSTRSGLAYKRALDLTFDVLTTPERLAVLEDAVNRCGAYSPPSNTR